MLKIISILRFISSKIKQKQKQNIHNYINTQHGKDYVFESIDNIEQGYYMTARGKGIKSGDIIILRSYSKFDCNCYRVKNISYYSIPSNIWIAHLYKENDKKVCKMD